MIDNCANLLPQWLRLADHFPDFDLWQGICTARANYAALYGLRQCMERASSPLHLFAGLAEFRCFAAGLHVVEKALGNVALLLADAAREAGANTSSTALEGIARLRDRVDEMPTVGPALDLLQPKVVERQRHMLMTVQGHTAKLYPAAPDRSRYLDHAAEEPRVHVLTHWCRLVRCSILLGGLDRLPESALTKAPTLPEGLLREDLARPWGYGGEEPVLCVADSDGSFAASIAYWKPDDALRAAAEAIPLPETRRALLAATEDFRPQRLESALLAQLVALARLRPFSAMENPPPAGADGPYPPDHFRWCGSESSRLPALEFRLLECLWDNGQPRTAVAIQDVIAHVYHGRSNLPLDPRRALMAVRRRAQRALDESDVPLLIEWDNGYLHLEPFGPG